MIYKTCSKDIEIKFFYLKKKKESRKAFLFYHQQR